MASETGLLGKAVEWIKGGASRPDVESRLRAALASNPSALADLNALIAERDIAYQHGHLWPHTRKYNSDIAAVVGKSCPAPTYFFHTTWSYGTPWGDLHNLKLAEIFAPYEESLIELIEQEKVPGSVVEFGIYEGYMLSRLIGKAESLGSKRQFVGFDSFEGLSEPSKENDYEGWQKGQYAAGYELVAANLRLAERPQLKLIKGWVEDSLKTPEALAVDPIAYARIDVDIYDPTVECLAYLSNRLANGAVLVFDDWAYTSDKGESRAFLEWVPKVPHLRFEWLGQCSSRVYFRVYQR